MLETMILGSIVFYFMAAGYLDSVYRERAKRMARRPFPDIWIVGGLPRKRRKKTEKVDWQNEGF